jgi:Ran GTPase-activating protein (RanGAP) involved in mRNA processing and transport
MSETGSISITLIELLNCRITPIGCSYLGKIMDTKKIFNLQYLTLNYNHIGNEGLSNLMYYMKDSKFLKYLSLGNCMIDENGVKLFAEFLNSTEVKLEELNLEGNPLKNPGVIEMFTMLYYNTSILEINLNNTMCGNDPDLAILIAKVMQNNSNLGAYYLNFNKFTEEGNYFFVIFVIYFI